MGWGGCEKILNNYESQYELRDIKWCHNALSSDENDAKKSILNLYFAHLKKYGMVPILI